MTQKEKINVAELLKDCPKGMELDCIMYDDITLLGVDDMKFTIFPIRVLRKDGVSVALTKYGQYTYADFAKCVIFPKGKTTWEGFQRPFEDGNILFVKSAYSWVFIYKESENKKDLHKYVAIPIHPKHTYIVYDNNPLCCKEDVSEIRFATEEEKEKLFKAIKDNGYKWNEETKTLEKLPKFNAGDKVKRKDADYTYIVTIAKLDDDYYDYVNEDGQCGVIHISAQNDWELVPDKFDINNLKPLQPVLVRDTNEQVWTMDLFSHKIDTNKRLRISFVCVGHYPNQCIPYEGNEHLLGTTNDCEEYYKNW